MNFWPFKKPAADRLLVVVDFVPTPPDPDWRPPPLPLADSTSSNKRTREEFVMSGAEWHAFRSQQLEAAGDEQEARLHLGDAAEYLTQIGGPNRVQSAEEVYQYCAARRAGEC